VIVVDGPATGHAVTFFLSPKGMLDSVRVGPVRTQAVDVTEMLADPERTAIVLVTIPEETPVNEVIETATTLADLDLPLGPLIVNGVYTPRDVGGLVEPEMVAAGARSAGVEVSPGDAARLAAAAEFLCRRRDLQSAQLQRLASGLDGGVGRGQSTLTQIQLPFLFAADLGRAELEVLAEEITGAMAAG
jgi:anion-transporting  ArsA/GET3 family ATPase